MTSNGPKTDLRRAILSLGAVNALDMALQVALPMVLVRLLSADDFGLYRMLWLLAGTALSVLPMAMPASLFYFLPRHQGADRSAYLVQTAGFMLVAALFGGLATWAWVDGQGLADDVRAPIVVFVALWLFASLLDGLFNAQQRNSQQAGVNLVFALLRFGLVVAVALYSRSIQAVLGAHLLLAAIKALYCGWSVARCVPGSAWGVFDRARWLEQLRYAAPFGASTGLYLLRGRIDQWLVAALFAPALFGLYSVASVFSPIQGLIRSTLNNVVLPELNRLQSGADVTRMVELNQRGNLAVAFVMFPVLGYLCAAVTPLLALLFTHDYTGAAPVVRWYCLMLLIESMEVTMLLTAFRQGGFLMKLDALVLAVSVAVSALGAWLFGLSGAALGGVASAAIAQFACYRRCAQLVERGDAPLQPWRPILRILIAAALAGGMVYGLIGAFVAQPAWLLLVGTAPTFVVIYWLVLRGAGLAPLFRQVFGPKLAAVLRF